MVSVFKTWERFNIRLRRCCLLAVCFLTEADILGDRIAIMAEGQLRCAGSSLFLKRHYGVGYQLTIEKKALVGKASMHVDQIDEDSMEFSCDVDYSDLCEDVQNDLESIVDQ